MYSQNYKFNLIFLKMDYYKYKYKIFKFSLNINFKFIYNKLIHF